MCACREGYVCSSCAEHAQLLRQHEAAEIARDFALEYVGWFTPEPNSDANLKGDRDDV